jgi:CRISPR-associated protein Csx14
MATSRIPVDLRNPGQVFACIGLVEAAGVLFGASRGGFDWSSHTMTHFDLEAEGGRAPVEAVLNFLVEAETLSVAPADSRNSTEKWQVPTQQLPDGHPFPFPDPSSPATLPVLLKRGNDHMTIDHWGDDTRRDTVKFWAGSGGYPGAALVRDALQLIRALPEDAAENPFAVRASQSSSLRLDWRRDYIPLDAGFSPNEHPDIVMQGYPIVEVLAAIGLTHARPERIRKLEYRYAVIGSAKQRGAFDPIFLRAALGCAKLPFPSRAFRMHLGWPGQENQARCITNVLEESLR